MSEIVALAAPAGSEHRAEWPLRPWLLAGGLGLAGLAIHALTHERLAHAWGSAGAAFVLFGAVAAAFTLERDRWRDPLLFALAAGLVMAGLAWRAVAGGDRYADPGYGFAAGVVATALALPLFQADFHRRRFRVPYPEFHNFVWTDAISAGGALAFTALSWIVLMILGQLFELLQIHLIRDLMREGAFGWTFSGIAFGAALGTIRNELRLLGTLRTIVVMVLSLLAVPVAIALAVFLASMLVSGPQVLWHATRSATPILLACAAGAFVLANTILRQDDEELPANRALRLASLVLALAILPLTAFAAVSMGTRIAQHGLSPERLWAVIAIGVACAYAVAYAVAVLGGLRGGRWRGRVRGTNLALATGVCAVALFLALPIFDFGAISASNQVGRLQLGKVSPDKFDFTALRWDFGAGGRRALARLARNGNGRVSEFARAALAQKERVYAGLYQANRTRADFKLRVQPDDADVRQKVLDYLTANPFQCQERCVALDLGMQADGSRRIALVQGSAYEMFVVGPGVQPMRVPSTVHAPVVLGPNSKVELDDGPVIRIDGHPIGAPID